MFGLLAGIIVHIGTKIQATFIDYHEINRAIRNHSETYTDYAGRRRDIVTGQFVFTRNRNGHIVKEDINGRVLKDYTQDAIDKEAARIRANPNGATVTYYSDGTRQDKTEYFYHALYYQNGIVGERYQDIKTGELYVERKFYCVKTKDNKYKCAIFYMNIKNGMLVRLSDKSKESNVTEEEAEKFINLFNKLQKQQGYGVATCTEVLDNYLWCNSFHRRDSRNPRKISREFIVFE